MFKEGGIIVQHSLDPLFDGTYSLMQRSFAGNPAWRNLNGKAYIYTSARRDGTLHWVFDNDLDGSNGILGGTLAQDTDKYPCIRGRGPEMWGGRVGLSVDRKTFHWNPKMTITPFGMVHPSCPALELKNMGHKCDTHDLCGEGLQCIVFSETENPQGEIDEENNLGHLGNPPSAGATGYKGRLLTKQTPQMKQTKQHAQEQQIKQQYAPLPVHPYATQLLRSPVINSHPYAQRIHPIAHLPIITHTIYHTYVPPPTRVVTHHIYHVVHMPPKVIRNTIYRKVPVPVPVPVTHTVYVPVPVPKPTVSPTKPLPKGICVKIVQVGEECKLNWIFFGKNNPRAWIKCAEGLRCTPPYGTPSGQKPDKGICTKDLDYRKSKDKPPSITYTDPIEHKTYIATAYEQPQGEYAPYEPADEASYWAGGSTEEAKETHKDEEGHFEGVHGRGDQQDQSSADYEAAVDSSSTPSSADRKSGGGMAIALSLAVVAVCAVGMLVLVLVYHRRRV